MHRFPKVFKAFYGPDPQDARLALGADFAGPEGYGEVVGGGRRAASLEVLLDQIEHHQLNRADYSGTGCAKMRQRPPTLASASGLERTVAWICRLPPSSARPFPTRMMQCAHGRLARLESGGYCVLMRELCAADLNSSLDPLGLRPKANRGKRRPSQGIPCSGLPR
ncbi:MAG: hypothetical protein IPO28_13445 [Holophagaceae bacterium]|nr:hypothetical protein [Holophagaceae bacterium]